MPFLHFRKIVLLKSKCLFYSSQKCLFLFVSTNFRPDKNIFILFILAISEDTKEEGHPIPMHDDDEYHEVPNTCQHSTQNTKVSED